MTAVFVCSPDEREKWLAARREGVSASEIAVILGISPYDSPFNAYWSKKLGWDSDVNELMNTGTWLEPTIAEWWADRDPTVVVCPAGLYAHAERPWQLASPDRLVCDPQMHDNPFPDDPSYPYDHAADAQHLAVLECKWVAHSWDGWGPAGTDEIPAHYLAQVLWQCDVMGVDTWHLCALGPTGFRAYTGAVDEAELVRMRAAGEEFMARLERDEPPPLDAHDATLGALKRLHPDLEDVEVEVPPGVADNYLSACDELRAVEADKQGYEIILRSLMGSARRAVHDGQKVATRVISEVAESTRTVAAHRRDYLLPPRAKKDTP